VETLSEEFEISKAAARRKVREAGGDASLALQRMMGIAEDDKGQAVLERVQKRLERLEVHMKTGRENGLDEKAALTEASRLLAEEDKAERVASGATA